MEIEQINTKFSINILQLLKFAHRQHGLQSHNHTRYRRYCTIRLRRLRKSLSKHDQGHGKTTVTAYDESSITQVGHLHVVLYMAERAWSHAMEKIQLQQQDDGRGRRCIYLLGRLRKALRWATLFAQLCATKADSRTSLEAEAYACYMKGTLLSQLDNWDTALTNFKTASAIYQELGKYYCGDLENQVLCHEHVQELEPSILYCLHRVCSTDQASSNYIIQDLQLPDLFKAKLVEARSQQQTAPLSLTTEFHWLVKELEKKLHMLAMADMKKLAIFDQILAAYRDARSCIRRDLIPPQITLGDDLNGLDKALTAVIGYRTIERNRLLVNTAKDKAKTDKLVERLIHLYDRLIRNTADLTDLLTSVRDKRTEEVTFAEECALAGLLYRAERCYYLAYALYCRSRSIADDALGKLQSMRNPDNVVVVQELKVLYNDCRSSICIEHALGTMEELRGLDILSTGVSSLSLNGAASKREPEKVLDNFDVYKSDAFPPSLQSAPCKPYIMNLALDTIKFPSLDNRVQKEERTLSPKQKVNFYSWITKMVD
ncbi:hypothetical protein AQUCO_00700829v1 [Aquilegia coerulea]|uniref:Signal recognition particle subunit SRP68 n=1 Tax=Aquilegia coerulea TaxID=218851 RepID=A0A2G5ELZ4_AQUCA|nr:hypothetical protein AQUCO_00700829v1 [Aquilegia coerulea]